MGWDDILNNNARIINSANQKFYDVITDLLEYEEAESEDTILANKYKICLKSIERCPLEIDKVENCIILNSFDQNIIERMQKKMGGSSLTHKSVGKIEPNEPQITNTDHEPKLKSNSDEMGSTGVVSDDEKDTDSSNSSEPDDDDLDPDVLKDLEKEVSSIRNETKTKPNQDDIIDIDTDNDKPQHQPKVKSKRDDVIDIDIDGDEADRQDQEMADLELALKLSMNDMNSKTKPDSSKKKQYDWEAEVESQEAYSSNCEAGAMDDEIMVQHQMKVDKVKSEETKNTKEDKKDFSFYDASESWLKNEVSSLKLERKPLLSTKNEANTGCSSNDDSKNDIKRVHTKVENKAGDREIEDSDMIDEKEPEDSDEDSEEDETKNGKSKGKKNKKGGGSSKKKTVQSSKVPKGSVNRKSGEAKKREKKTSKKSESPEKFVKIIPDRIPGKNRGKEYIPKPGTGGYAILLALYLAEGRPNYKGYMSKDELIDAAQPFCNVSLRFSKPGQQFWYNGYSMSKQLVKKGYIVKQGNPHKIWLTDDGKELAKTLMKTRELAGMSNEACPVEYENENNSNTSKTPSSNVSSPSAVVNKDEDAPHSQQINSDTEEESDNAEVIDVDDPEPAEFLYCYTYDENEFDDRNKADLTCDDDTGDVMYLAICRKEDLENKCIRYQLKDGEKPKYSGFVYAYIHENDCKEKGPVASIRELRDILDTLAASKRSGPVKKKMTLLDSYRQPIGEAIPAAKKSKIVLPPLNKELYRREVKKDPVSNAAKAAIRRAQQSDPSYFDDLINDKELHLDEKELDEWNIEEPSVDNEPTNNKETRIDDIGHILEPGHFKIVLIVDAMEVTGGSERGKNSRKSLTTKELEDLGVEFETRRIPVGDFCWIAKEITADDMLGNALEESASAAQQRRIRDEFETRELVLDFIVERKREDDLVSSIMDGRYEEQKQRLKASKLKNLIYLIEEGGDVASGRDYAFDFSSQFNGKVNKKRGVDRDAMEQAITNTNIRGFQIRRTRSQRDTMMYIAAATSVLIEKYRNKSLQGISMKDLEKRKSIVESSNTTTHYLSNFAEFSEQCKPDKALTVREAFSNMIYCLKGLSPGMAWAITEHYPTPFILYQQFKRLKESSAIKEKDREKEINTLVKRVIGTYDYPLNKSFPQGIAKTIAKLFTSATLK